MRGHTRSAMFPLLPIAIVLATILGHEQEPSRDRFQLNYQPTLESVETDYEIAMQRLKEVKQDKVEQICKSDWLNNNSPRDINWDHCYLEPPFPVLSDATTYPEIYPWLGWAPASNSATRSLLSQWEKSANDASVANCKDSNCERIIHTITNRPKEYMLARCNISVALGSAGPPWNCQPIAIGSGEKVFLRVVIAYSHIQARGTGLPDFRLRIVSKSTPAITAIAEAVRQALSEAPLLLNTEIYHGTSLVGNRKYERSEVLRQFKPPLREMVTVRVDMFGAQRDQLATVDMIISTTIYVNLLNTTRPEDWTLPDQVKENVYITAIRNSLKSHVARTCTTSHWRSEQILTCGISANDQLPPWIWD